MTGCVIVNEDIFMSDYIAYSAEINIVNSEVTVNKNNNTTIYEAIGECNGNQMLLMYIVDSSATPEDWAFDVLNNMYRMALEYLSTALLKNENVFVNLFRYKNAQTTYDIYYDCDTMFNSPSDAAMWIMVHGGVKNIGAYYTETRDGKTKAIEFSA